MVIENLVTKFESYSGFAILRRQIELFENFTFEGFLSTDEDMLLFQWGCYEWGEGEFFEIDLTRQLSGPPDTNTEQLSCTLYFQPNKELQALGSGNFWCSSRSETKKFWSDIINHASFNACKNLTAIKSNIEAECV
ncbi:hypothetical protein [Bowmanella denitrificans]|uniref:hypothetical protein n=1 Tax=Bowmanella denitrificans TaxID=366582 RepID=UPI000C9A6C49|nr:hypothetical protein [Bowmanella denitrificans]